jgi:hypothetical protein
MQNWVEKNNVRMSAVLIGRIFVMNKFNNLTAGTSRLPPIKTLKGPGKILLTKSGHPGMK